MPPRLRSLLLSGLALALLGVGAASLFGFLARWLWFADLITPFRLQIAIAAAVLCAACLLMRHRLLITASLAAFVLTLAPIIIRSVSVPALPAPEPAAKPISLVMSNVLYVSKDYDAVLDMVAREDPDIFAVVEAADHWQSALSVLDTRYPYSYDVTGRSAFGITLYAKAPFTARVITPAHAEVPLLRAEFDDFILLVAHPVPPISAAYAIENSIYLKALANQVRDAQKPVIVTGDLNSTLWSHSLTPLVEAKMQRPKGSGFAYTWPAGNPLMAIQIDHVLTRDIPAARFKVLPSVGSDHFPIRADIVLGARP
ncbi:endonuclease/exonuclease/phosphatase family protein [Asticcacaulis sp. ZE23SCel15]|uniref:endonuclease/exonuclease/phosphatase family protein n=1 Tax=Asticcacaulis sp. ZE23SCel15 TaxID=3059027 RepID=UPI00265FAF63|nr:endonuclease/exonuclease/phosphatase family protein [Asticcacaulis sp. ZE23SCel15]WKL57057.1 endonuclease/exonuclease/phosphatase family protein [Asticcacaulis sp. ZE23SCel15]